MFRYHLELFMFFSDLSTGIYICSMCTETKCTRLRYQSLVLASLQCCCFNTFRTNICNMHKLVYNIHTWTQKTHKYTHICGICIVLYYIVYISHIHTNHTPNTFKLIDYMFEFCALNIWEAFNSSAIYIKLLTFALLFTF